jgi:Zn-dependent protease
MLFTEPQPTQYDLRFSLAGIPVRVHPLFWLMGIFLGGITGNLVSLIIWIAAVFVSILVHELGHAFAMRLFDQPSRVVLYMMGGLTIPEASPWIGRWATISQGPTQQILISLAGPGAGFLLAVLVIVTVLIAGGSVFMTALFGVIPLPAAVLPSGGQIVNQMVMSLLWINVFWGLVNLLPVYPLDGGNVARHLLIKADPLDGLRKSLWLTVIVGALAALAGVLLFGSFYIALLYGVLAFESYQQLQGRSGRLW